MGDTSYSRYKGPLISPEQARKLRKEMRAQPMDYIPRQVFETVRNDSASAVLENIYDSCGDFVPFDTNRIIEEWSVTETFDSAPGYWVNGVDPGDSQTFSYTADPAGQRTGLVKKIFCGRSDNGYTYADAIGDKSILGMLSGKVEAWVYQDGTDETYLWPRIRTLGNSNVTSSPCYVMQWFWEGVSPQGFTPTRLGGGGSFGFDDLFTDIQAQIHTWQKWVWEWQEVNFSDYGRVFFFRHKIDDHRWTAKMTFTYDQSPHWKDVRTSGTLINSDNPNVRFIFETHGPPTYFSGPFPTGPTGTLYLDDIKFTKYKDVIYVA